MVSKAKRRQAIVPKRDPDAGLEIELGEADLKVDEMKSALEETATDCISNMRKVVEDALMRLPTKIKNMQMREFMTEYKGEVAMVLEKEKKQNRIARTVAKPLPGSRLDNILSSVKGGAGNSILSRLGASGAVGGGITGTAAKQAKLYYSSSAGGAGCFSATEEGGVESSSFASSSSSFSAAPMVGSKRHADGTAVGGASAPTPGKGLMPSRTAGFNPLLPKTPHTAARKPKKGETVTLVAVSVNGSPLGAVPGAVLPTGAVIGAGSGLDVGSLVSSTFAGAPKLGTAIKAAGPGSITAGLPSANPAAVAAPVVVAPSAAPAAPIAMGPVVVPDVTKMAADEVQNTIAQMEAQLAAMKAAAAKMGAGVAATMAGVLAAAPAPSAAAPPAAAAAPPVLGPRHTGISAAPKPGTMVGSAVKPSAGAGGGVSRLAAMTSSSSSSSAAAAGAGAMVASSAMKAKSAVASKTGAMPASSIKPSSSTGITSGSVLQYR